MLRRQMTATLVARSRCTGRGTKQMASPAPKACVTPRRCSVHSSGSASRAPNGRRNQRSRSVFGSGISLSSGRGGIEPRTLPGGRGSMPRRLLKRLIPDPNTLRERWYLRPFGARLADPLLWTLHRRGVTHAFGAGLAICFVPLPVHLLLATSVAVIWRLNIPVICGTTFLLNPFTAVPAYYLAYRVGAALLH